MTPAHVGIDLGTSAVKVLVQDDTGRALAKASRPYPTGKPRPGWAEQAPEEWWSATAGALRAALAAAAGAEVRSVGLSGQLNGFVLLDAAGAPLAPAVIWLDLRAAEEAAALAAAADFPALTGNALSPIAVLPKLAWFRRHRPDALDRAAHILLAKDWLLWKLTGAMATDPSDAACTAMTGPDGLAWDAALAGRAGVAPDRLPPIRAATAVAGRITAGAAAATGLPEGAPVATGAGDVAALATGCGVVRPGRVAITLGTAGHVVGLAPPGAAAPGQGLWRMPHALTGAALLLGLIMAGGLSLAWLREVFGAGRAPPDFADLEALAAASPPGARGVTFLPFLEGAGTPHLRPEARGSFLGLSSAHGAGELVRAVMEGVAFNAADCVAALRAAGAPADDIRLAEGGARSPLWCQILADALGAPVALLAEGDSSAAGAALIGRAAAEGGDLAALADAACRPARRFAPGADRAATAEAAARYRAALARALG